MAAPALAADVAHGQEVYRACAACHTEKPYALGPSLKGVIGRKSAALEDFRYSNPMRRANLVWDEATLTRYLPNPQSVVPGTKMAFPGLKDPQKVKDVIAFLSQYKPDGSKQ